MYPLIHHHPEMTLVSHFFLHHLYPSISYHQPSRPTNNNDHVTGQPGKTLQLPPAKRMPYVRRIQRGPPRQSTAAKQAAHQDLHRLKQKQPICGSTHQVSNSDPAYTPEERTLTPRLTQHQSGVMGLPADRSRLGSSSSIHTRGGLLIKR